MIDEIHDDEVELVYDELNPLGDAILDALVKAREDIVDAPDRYYVSIVLERRSSVTGRTRMQGRAFPANGVTGDEAKRVFNLLNEMEV